MSPLSLGEKKSTLGQVLTFLVVGELVSPQFPLLRKTYHTGFFPTSKSQEKVSGGGGIWLKTLVPPLLCVHLVLSDGM